MLMIMFSTVENRIQESSYVKAELYKRISWDFFIKDLKRKVLQPYKKFSVSIYAAFMFF